jgi:flagellar basal-body rod modification protein FlgD
MTMLSSVSSGSNPQGLQAALNTGGKAQESSQDRFLTLLVAQMQNQDPLNPMDNAQMTSQLAQINTVQGINSLNDTVKGLGAQFAALQSLQSAALVGKNVLVAGDTATLAGGNMNFGYELPMDVDAVKIEVLDARGNVVRSFTPQERAMTSAGVHGMSWDGKTADGRDAPEGEYRLRVSSITAGREASNTALTGQRVAGVTADANGVQLLLANGNRAPYTGVKAVF